MNYGYIRVSTNKQDESNQELELLRYVHTYHVPIDEFVRETISSRKDLEERKLSLLIKKLKKGDKLLVVELSRLGRSLLEVMEIIHTLLKKEVEVIVTSKQLIIGDNIQSKALVFAFGIASEVERELISQRTRIGLQNAKAKGKKIGRPKGATSNSKLDPHQKEIAELLNKGVSKASICKIYDVSYPTLENFLKSRKISAIKTGM